MTEEQPKPFISLLEYHPLHGRSYCKAVCSKCGEMFNVYLWSFAGSGKKCPKCGEVYGWFDHQKPEVVKLNGQWVDKVGNYYFVWKRLTGWIRVQPSKETTQ